MNLQKYLTLFALTMAVGCNNREFNNSETETALSGSAATSNAFISRTALAPHGEALWQVYLNSTGSQNQNSTLPLRAI